VPDKRRLPRIRARREREPSRLFRIEALDLEFSNGARRTYERLLTSGLGAVIIVPLIDSEHVLLIREYACGVHRYEIGLPKGRLEPGETLHGGAQRELREETGYGARSFTTLAELTLSPGYMTHVTHVVVARDLYPARLPGDEPEEIEVITWPLDDLAGLVARDDCTEGRTLAALYIVRDLIRSR